MQNLCFSAYPFCVYFRTALVPQGKKSIDIFIAKLLSVGNIPYGTDMTLIGKVQIDLTASFQLFKCLQLLGFILIKLWRGNSPWAFSYSLISCANAKKTFEGPAARFFPCCILPIFPGFAHALPVLFDNLANRGFVRSVHDR